MLEKTLENPLDGKKIKPVYPKGNQPWIFIRRIDAEAETPKLWPPDVKNWLIGKYPDAGKDGRQKEKGMIEDEMVEWHHWLDGHEFEQALGVGYGQWRLACYSPWGHKESDTPEWLNWNVGSKLSKHSKEFPSNFFLSLRVVMNQASPTPANSLNPSDSSDGTKVSLPTRGTIQDFYQLICPWYQINLKAI